MRVDLAESCEWGAPDVPLLSLSKGSKRLL